MYSDDVNGALLALCTAIVLRRMGKPQYEKIVANLEEDYAIHIYECNKNPQALKQAIQDIFGDSYNDILEEIKAEIERWH